MSHTHWPDGRGPVCTFRTKRECDLALSAMKRESKRAYEESRAAAKAATAHLREQQYLDYTAKENARKERLLRDNPPV